MKEKSKYEMSIVKKNGFGRMGEGGIEPRIRKGKKLKIKFLTQLIKGRGKAKWRNTEG